MRKSNYMNAQGREVTIYHLDCGHQSLALQCPYCDLKATETKLDAFREALEGLHEDLDGGHITEAEQIGLYHRIGEVLHD